jgi:chromosome segregation ATPase
VFNADFLGTLPGWVTSAGVLGILGLVVRWQLGLRRIGVDAQQVDNADEADIRDHYAQEIAAMRLQLTEQDDRNRTKLERADQRIEECMEGRDELRARIRELEETVDGLKRQIVRYSADTAIELDPSPMVRDAAERVRDIQENGDRK